jgi:hypothetical protein
MCEGTDHNEAYIMLVAPGSITAKVGEQGQVIFTAGGPTGAHWRWKGSDDIATMMPRHGGLSI